MLLLLSAIHIRLRRPIRVHVRVRVRLRLNWPVIYGVCVGHSTAFDLGCKLLYIVAMSAFPVRRTRLPPGHPHPQPQLGHALVCFHFLDLFSLFFAAISSRKFFANEFIAVLQLPASSRVESGIVPSGLIYRPININYVCCTQPTRR